MGLQENNINTFEESEMVFLKMGRTKDDIFLFACFNNAKKNYNEKIMECNKRFDDIVQRMHNDIKLPMIFIDYINACDGKFSFWIREKYSQNLKEA